MHFFVNINIMKYLFYHILAFVIHTNTHLKNMWITLPSSWKTYLITIAMLWNFNILFKGRLSSKLNSIFMKSFGYSLSLLLFIIIAIYLLLIQSSVYLFDTFLFPSIEAKVKYLFALLSSIYPYTSQIIRYSGFTVLTFT